MSLDPRTIVIAQISAAVACNALASLRVAITEAIEMGIDREEIQEILILATGIQQQPINHIGHLAEQLLQEPSKKTHVHSAHCGCGGHHA
jgi:alkylhydroperoxidase/carboxymuconolactone decarboxylase family protein YurZ